MITDPTIQQQVKKITWETNYNNKLACQAFTHLDLWPIKAPLHSQLESYIIEIHTADGSHPPVQKKLYSLMPIKLHQISDILSFGSHGITAMDFQQWLINKYPQTVKPDTEIAIYFYLPIND